MGILDKPEDINLSETLLVVLDTPDTKRIDGIEDLNEYGSIIKTLVFIRYPEPDDPMRKVVREYNNRAALSWRAARNFYFTR